VLRAQSAALAALAELLGPEFAAALELLLACTGRVIVSGMGKSGLVGQKIAASLSSTGQPAHFLHPAEGMHGDLGMVQPQDLLLAISRSGETAELLDLLPPLRRLGVPVIAITAQPDSSLGRAATVVLSLGDHAESDPHNLVPTTSTTLTLALGDALVVALMEARGFGAEDFAQLHPQGMLGRRLTLTVADLLRGPATNPVVPHSAALRDALHVISQFALGGSCVVDDAGRLAGILTDGDVRRIFERLGTDGATVGDALAKPVEELMSRQPATTGPETLAYDALQLMEQHQPRPIFILPVVDAQLKPVGMLHLHALVQAGFKARRPGPANPA
jgi:arabinose-5-phosphate isomerase